MSSPGRVRRAWGLLQDAGDALAWVIDRQNDRWRTDRPSDNDASVLWEEQRAHGPFGALAVACAQDVILTWQRAFFEAARRMKSGEDASYPMRKRRYVPVSWRKGRFTLTEETPAVRGSSGEVVVRRMRPTVTLEMARGAGPLVLRVSHFHPYAPDLVRAVRLVPAGDELFIDVTAWVQVERAAVVAGRVAGADPGIIHTWAVSWADQALLVSGRGVRAEERLHLEDTEARTRKKSAKARPVRARPGSPRQSGSRRWRHIHAAQKRADARNRRRRSHANDTAANHVKAFVVDHGVETLRLGDPAGTTDRDCGAVHNRRVHRWPRARQRDAVIRRVEEVGITAEPVDERGSSSRCPTCGARATKHGRRITCTAASCGTRHHRDLAGSQNIARQGEESPRTEITSVEHRRVGKPARRDRRRQLWVARRRAESEGNARIRAAEAGTIPAEESSVAPAA